MLAGQRYDSLDPELVQARLDAKSLCARLNAAPETDPARRDALAQLFGRGGDTVTVTSPFHCGYGSNIELGEKAFFNFNCVVLDVCKVSIGSFTLLGPAVQFYAALHPVEASRRRVEEHGRSVMIGSDVWVGGGAIILPGVTIGDRSIIGAGSVVTRGIPADVFAACNPCRVIRNLDQAEA
ncbi:MAG: Maltose O-acetyltransferase [Ramlibacter sp.]|nr:Maltose O-acetyltransferase [Ramlibacter sp.]